MKISYVCVNHRTNLGIKKNKKNINFGMEPEVQKGKTCCHRPVMRGYISIGKN